MSVIRDIALNYINDLPEDALLSLLPLLKKLSTDVIYLEKVSFDDLTEEEKKAVTKGDEEAENDELIDFEDYIKQRNDE